MELTEEQLKEIQSFAEAFMDPDTIAMILQIDREEFRKEIRTENSPAYIAFMTGMLKTEAAIRKATITFAKQGSTPALTAAIKFRDELKLKLIKSS